MENQQNVIDHVINPIILSFLYVWEKREAENIKTKKTDAENAIKKQRNRRPTRTTLWKKQRINPKNYSPMNN